MTYRYSIMRNGLRLGRTLNAKKAVHIAALYLGATVLPIISFSGCTGQHAPIIPCNADNCGKNPGGK